MDLIAKKYEVDVDGVTLALIAPARAIGATPEIIIVLLDPDTYLAEPAYREARRAGAPAIRNLQGFARSGAKLWEAEMPEANDYYYELVNDAPIEVLSFSSFRCVIDPRDGRITSREFLK